MPNKKDRLRSVVGWLTPSVSELVIYLFVAISTLFISNVSFVRDFIFAPSDFSLWTVILDSINSLLDRFVGEGTARTVVVIVFWALVGLLVYAVIWVLSNFSDELGNDLALTKYVHPRNVDTSSPLRDFISRTLFRIAIFVLLVFYAVIFWQALLPFCMDQFRQALGAWPTLESFKAALIGVAVQVITLHVFIVFARLLFLKKRIFD